MNRRKFLTVTASAAAGAAGMLARRLGAAEGAPAAAAERSTAGEQMKVGCQRRGSSAEHMPFLQRCGVRHICASPARGGPDKIWTEQTCRERIRQVEDLGMKLELMYWGVRRDVLIPERRDGAIERCRKEIEAAGKAGIPALQYNLNVRVWRARTGRVPGRGGSTYSEWDVAKVEPQKKPFVGEMDAREHWNRIRYFLERVVPVAEKYKVRLACHPNDPPIPDKNRWNVDQVLDTVPGLKKFVQTCQSDYHGLLFCQGCVWEMLPKQQKPHGLYDAIRWFGSRNKIFSVHFRNLRGGPEKFIEVYPDEGEIDMARAVQTYKDVGYTGMLMPDHVPGSPEDKGNRTGFAFAYGYIMGLIEMAYAADRA